MTPEQAEALIMLHQRQATALEQIALILAKSTPKQEPPNYKAILETFNEFNWASISAEVETTDNYGVASVIWQGDRYKRRSPQNAYGAVIFFSKCVGKAETGNNQYERLITFEPAASLKVEPISKQAEAIVNQWTTKL